MGFWHPGYIEFHEAVGLGIGAQRHRSTRASLRDVNSFRGPASIRLVSSITNCQLMTKSLLHLAEESFLD